MLNEILILYGFLSISHLLIQIHFAHLHYRTFKSNKIISFKPSVTIVIPSYNEPVKELYETVKSALEQDYNGNLIVCLIDDGSINRTAYDIVTEKFNHNLKFRHFISEKNKGKRYAQKLIFDKFKDSDFFLTIDSDTVLEKNAVKKMIHYFGDDSVGIVTGNVRVKNHNNLLTKLIDIRYWTAFNYERASQSFFGNVLCASGPLSMYRGLLINKVKERYIRQRFLGKECTYGDDRHLTNLILQQQFKVIYAENVEAWTIAPEKIKQWMKQQNRWSKSFYRELIWTFKNLILKKNSLHLFVIYDLSMQFLLPILLLLAIIIIVLKSLTVSPLIFIGYLTIVLIISFLRSGYAFLRTHDPRFFMFVIYSILHIFLLVPLRLYSLVTLWNTRWGTR